MLEKLEKIRSNITIRRRLILLICVLILLIGFLGYFSMHGISQINHKVSELDDKYFVRLVQLSKFTKRLYSIVVENHILISNRATMVQLQNRSALEDPEIDKYLDEFRYSMDESAATSLIFSGFLDEFKNYKNISKEINTFLIAGEDSSVYILRTTKELTSFRKIQEIVQKMMESDFENINKTITDIQYFERKTITEIYIVCLIILIFNIFVGYFLIKDLTISLKNLKTNLQILSTGEIPKEKILENDNEIGKLSKQTNLVAENFRYLQNFALDISTGNYKTQFESLGKQDVFGNTLLNLRDNLKKAQEEENKRKIEDQRRDWTNRGLAKFGEILRQNSDNIEKLGDEVIKNLVHYLNANQGGIFIYNNNDKNDVFLELLSAFAYDRKKYFQKKIYLGDGLIGACALEKNTIYLTEIPQDYIEIESGLGDSSPRSLLIVPLKLEKEILGVAEIASFKNFQKHEREFTEKIAESIASTLVTTRINAKTSTLLQESQKQSQELALREKEMRKTMEEMAVAHEESARREAEMTGILKAIDSTLMKAEYQTDGLLLSVNTRWAKTLEYKPEDVIGKNIRMFIPPHDLDNFLQIWQKVCSGHSHSASLKRKTKSGKDLWLLTQYTPVHDQHGNVMRILYLANDITEQHLKDEEMKRQAQTLIEKDKEVQKTLEDLRHAQEESAQKAAEIGGVLKAVHTASLTLEMNLTGKILDINNEFVIILNSDKKEILQKSYENLYIFSEGIDMEMFWNDLRKGISRSKVGKITLEDGDTIWLNETFCPILDRNGKPYKILNIAIDITESKLKEQEVIDKEKELRQNVEELVLTQEEMEKAQIEMQGLINAVNYSLIKGEYDSEANFIHINQKFLDVLGYSHEEIIHKNVRNIFPPDDIERFNQIWEGVIRDGTPYQGVLKRVTKAGEILWFVTSYSPVFDNKGNILKVVSLAYDISQQKLAEEQAILKKQELERQESTMMQNMEELLESQELMSFRLNEFETREKNVQNQFSTDIDIDKLYEMWLKSV